MSARGDAADDPAIWVAPQPEESRILGTQKKGTLYVYDLSGDVVQEISGGRPNNVDVRDGFPWPDGAAPIVAVSDRSDNAILLRRLDPKNGRLEAAPRMRIPTGFGEVYGVCLGRQGADFIAVATSRNGEVATWRLIAGEEPAADRIGGFSLSGAVEGCVVDDALGLLYTAEETRGIWRTRVDDPNGVDRSLIDQVSPSGNLAADVEGLALWIGPGESGFLVASSQGNSRFAVYDRSSNAYRGSVRIGPSQDGSTDGVSGTDGIEIVSASLSPELPRGLLVAQDDRNSNPSGAQNFKLVSWADLEKALRIAPETPPESSSSSE